MGKPLIMVVDDDKDVADEIAASIKDTEKYEVATVYSARDALRLIEKNKKLMGNRNRIELIVLDIKMPEMNGLELLARIRLTYPDDKMGVIMLTAYEDADKWEKATDGHVAGYLKKPFKEEELLKTLERYFSSADEKTKMIFETFEKHVDKMEDTENK
ncbi:MAG: response regulator [Candidatus Margulisiibacteriota bacterium]